MAAVPTYYYGVVFVDYAGVALTRLGFPILQHYFLMFKLIVYAFSLSLNNRLLDNLPNLSIKRGQMFPFIIVKIK